MPNKRYQPPQSIPLANYNPAIARAVAWLGIGIYWPSRLTRHRVLNRRPSRASAGCDGGSTADSECGRTSEISSLSRERNIFKIGDALLFLYPTARSMVGTSPFSGRLTTDHGNKFFAYAGISERPRVEATKEIAMAMLSTPCAGVISTPARFRKSSVTRRKTVAFRDPLLKVSPTNERGSISPCAVR